MTGQPKVSVFLPSYNKGAYVLDAIRSVVEQTFTDWELWILENSTDDGLTRALIEGEVVLSPDIHYELIDHDTIPSDVYPTAWLLNQYYPKAEGEYIFYISDDDIIRPRCLELLAGYLDTHPNDNVSWAGCQAVKCHGPGDFGPYFVQLALYEANRVLHQPGQADCRIDGGQIMHRKSVLDDIAYPYFPEDKADHTARHADGLFMEKLLAAGHHFYPVMETTVVHRYTPLSVMTAHPNIGG